MLLIISLETSKDVEDNNFNDLRQSKLHLQKKKYIKCWTKVHLLSVCKGGGVAAKRGEGGTLNESSGKLRSGFGEF